ncbi:MAG: isoleucine--tRNA ligase, partial [Elioraea sp.]|nr:isoleucine--tRNA ligase [Elioraea sp.]
NETIAQRMARIREIRRVITGALERERAAGAIGASLQAAPVLVLPAADRSLLDADGWAEICITSGMTLADTPPEADVAPFSLDDVPGVTVIPRRALGEKCLRCWKVLPEVGTHPDHPGLCDRCHDAVTSGVLARRAAA